MNFKVKYIFIFNAVLALFFGLGFMFIPEILMTMIGFSDEADGPTAFRFFGILVFGISILTFAVRNEDTSSVRRSIILFLFIAYVLMVVFHFIFCDLSNLMLWFVIVIHTILAIAYGYFLFKK